MGAIHSSCVIELRAGQGARFAYESGGLDETGMLTFTFVDYDTQNTYADRILGANTFPKITFAGTSISVKA